MMRLLFVNPSSGLYGSERCLLQLVQFLSPRHDIHIALPNDGPLATAVKKYGAHVYFVDANSFTEHLSARTFIRELKQQISRTHDLTRLIQTVRPNLVYSNNTIMLASGFAAKKTNAQHLYHVRGVHDRNWWSGLSVQFMLPRLCTAMVAMSDFSGEFFRRFAPHTLPIKTFYEGIDASHFNKPSKKPEENKPIALGMAGWVDPRKGQHIFVELIRQLRQDGLNVRGVIAGDARDASSRAYKAQLQNQIHEAKLSDHIQWLGFQSDLKDFYSNLDIFIMPATLPEGFGMVTLEAMASGLPVVATGIGGQKELVQHEVTGYLGSIEPSSLAVWAKRLIHDPNLRFQMGQKGHERCLSQFDAQKNYSAIENFIQSYAK